MNKEQIRQHIRLLKKNLSVQQLEQKSEILAAAVHNCNAYQSARCIYCYLSVNQEVRTWPIIHAAWEDGKRVAVPKVHGKELRFYYLTAQSPLEQNGFLLEPAQELEEANEDDALIIVPGLAFDSAGNRIGYGGGYYDRYLHNHPNHATIGLCFDFQFLPEIPAQSHDIPVRQVIWA